MDLMVHKSSRLPPVFERAVKHSRTWQLGGGTMDNMPPMAATEDEIAAIKTMIGDFASEAGREFWPCKIAGVPLVPAWFVEGRR
jgi:hypothetical protein